MKPIKLAVVGLGQIGGSIVLSLRARNANYHITGIEKSSRRLRLITDQLDHASTRWQSADNADLILVCLHFDGTLNFLLQAPSSTLIMDVCSAKTKLVDVARRKKLRFIGGHPMAGNEFEGEKGWDRNLFEGSSFFLCPASDTRRSEIRIAKRLVQDVGSHPVIVSPEKHDRAVAATSHFPAFLSRLLRQTTNGVPQHFTGPGYHSMIRLSKTPAKLLNTFLQSNRSNILQSAESFQRALQNWIKKEKAD